MSRLVHVCIIAACMAVTHGFWHGDEKVDCQVTLWSEWTTSSAWEATSKIRTRHILRHPMNGGTECPAVKEEELIEKTERIALTASNMARSFASPRTGNVGHTRDLLVIVDSSGSIGSRDFQLAKESLVTLLGTICPLDDPFSQNKQKAALLRYSSSVTEIFDFNANSNTAEVQDGIMNMGYSGGSTCTGEAFNYALSTMFKAAKGMREGPYIKHEVLILTDGRSNCALDAVKQADMLQEANIGVYGLMVGNFTAGGKSELEAYVSEVGSHLFAVEDFQDLKLLVDAVIKVVQGGAAPCMGLDLTN